MSYRRRRMSRGHSRRSFRRGVAHVHPRNSRPISRGGNRL